MAPRKDVIIAGGTRIPAAEDAILKLLDTKKNVKPEDTMDLWNKLKEGPLKSMRDDKGLIKLLKGKENHISRMWEIAACKYEHIADLRVPEDKAIKALRDKAPNDPAVRARLATAFHDHAVAAINAMLPQANQADQPHVKWIGRRGKKNEGGDTLYFPWESSSKGVSFKEEFEMTISNGVKPNEYRVRFGGIGGENSKKHHVVVDIPGDILLSVERNPDHLPLPHAVTSLDPFSGAPKSCVVAFTFGVAQDQIIVYIRFASPTVLVGKAFKANWKNEDKELWGDLILAKIN